MADRYINWPPPKEAVIPLVRALARLQFERDCEASKAAGKKAAGAIPPTAGPPPAKPPRAKRLRKLKS